MGDQEWFGVRPPLLPVGIIGWRQQRVAAGLALIEAGPRDRDGDLAPDLHRVADACAGESAGHV